MAAHRKPSNILSLTGSFKENPQLMNNRIGEPKKGKPFNTKKPPKGLSEHETECWFELVEHCHEGTLTKNDALVVEHGARLLAALRSLEVYDDHKTMIRFEAVLARLGLTPADRSRVQVLKLDEENGTTLDEFRKS